jgi:hypothetical protein
MVGLEDDLIDAYARDDMSDAQRERFERVYLSSPELRQRVEFARALKAAAAQESGAMTMTAPGSHAWSQRLFAFASLPRRDVLAWSPAVATSVMLVASSWLVIDAIGLRTELERARVASAALQQREQELQRQVATERGRSDRLATEVQSLLAESGPAANATSAPPVARSVIASFTLASGLVRGSGASRTVMVPSEAEIVQLWLSLDAPEHGSYRAVITTIAGEDIWSHSRLTAQRTKEGAGVPVTVPATALTNGDYILMLSGVTPESDREVVEEYSFRVGRR